MRKELSMNNSDFFKRKSIKSEKFKEIHRRLRNVLLVLSSLSFFIGFLVFVPISQVFTNLNYQCPIYAQIDLAEVSISRTNITLVLNHDKSIWSNQGSLTKYLNE